MNFARLMEEPSAAITGSWKAGTHNAFAPLSSSLFTLLMVLVLSGADFSYCFPDSLQTMWICFLGLGVLLAVHAALDEVPAAIVDAAQQMSFHTGPHMQCLLNRCVLCLLQAHRSMCPQLFRAI